MSPKRRLTIDDILRLQRPSDPRVSARGDVAFVVTRNDLENNKVTTEIHIVWRDGATTFLVGQNDSMPRWSPDGSLLAFTSRRGVDEKVKGNGVFVWSGRGEPRKVAWFKHGVSHLEWIDNDSLVLVAPIPRPGFYDEEGDYVVTDRLPLWFDGEGLIGGLQHGIFVVDVSSGTTRRLTVEESPITALTICEGKIYYATPIDWRRPTHKKIVMLDPTTSQKEVVLEDYAVAELRCIEGKLYALMHRHEIGIASHYKLWVIDEKPSCISCGVLDRNIRALPGGMEDRPLIIYADAGSMVLAELDEGKVRDYTKRGVYVEAAHAENNVIAYIASSPTKPQEVFLYTRDAGPKQITKLNEWLVREVKLYEPRHYRLTAEGEEIDGWVMIPESDGRKPLILYIHGGPKGMYGYYFHPEMQLMAAEGFIVAFSNPHGSDGYSEEFADIRGKYGDIDYKQLMAFLDNVLEQLDGIVDRERMAVTGISYGGYMTNVIVTKTDKFRAAVSENGIADWIADYWASDIGYWFNPDQIGGTPLDNLEEYVRKSPVYNVDKVKTPMLIIHSMQDYRCFIDQALAMHTALVMNGKESKLVVFTKGGHGHSLRAEPRHRRKRYEIKVSWLKEKLGLNAKSET